MWKLLKIIGFLLKAFFWLFLLLVLLALSTLYVLERGIPEPLVRRLSSELSTDDLLIRIDRVTYSLKSGLRLHRVKALPKRVADAAFVSADEIAFDIALSPGLAPNERLRGVSVKNISMPALPPERKDKNEPKKPEPVLPDIQPFSVTVENADILGLKASRVTATVSLEPKRVNASEIKVLWPDKAFSMSVAGQASADFGSRLVSGTVKGQAFPENILPLLHALKARGAIRQVEYFSKIEKPVDAEATFNVNIDNSDFTLLLGLDVGPCEYRGVPMKSASGPLYAYGTNIYTTVEVGPIHAESATGPLDGRIVYDEATEGVDIEATSHMDLMQLVTVIDVLNKGELERVRCAAPPLLSVRGVVAASSTRSSVTNALSGKASLSQGTILNFTVKDTSGDFTLDGYRARFDNVTGLSASGGKLRGNVDFHFPNYAATSTVFNTRLTLDGVDLSELSRAFNVTNARAGLVSGEITLGGPTSKHLTIPKLSGQGRVRITDGVIHRMKLFAGFTDYLAKTIPGISSLVNQSSGAMDFTIRDGVLYTENLLLEGDVFSIKGSGSYSFVTDKLDFVIRANVFKQKTLAGKITHFVTLPFTRLLLEFKVFGSLDNPDWSYVNIIEKITDSLSDLSVPAAPATDTPAP